MPRTQPEYKDRIFLSKENKRKDLIQAIDNILARRETRDDVTDVLIDCRMYLLSNRNSAI